LFPVNSNLASETPNPPPGAGSGLAGRWRLVPFLVILIAALAYYGSYWHFWFNPHDESGTAVLIAQRLMKGERPWVDFEPGYNIGWFYPLVGLFHFTGVNFLAARAWFFVLSTITAFLGCSIVTRVSGSRWLGLATGLLLVVFPGSQFKNYIPLAEAANTACLIHFCFVDPAVRRKWLGAAAVGGVVLGLTFLVRVELGYFFTAIWALLFIVSLFDRRLPFWRHFIGIFLGVTALVFGVLLAQAPMYSSLRARGLESQYWEEYTDWLQFLRASAEQRLQKPKQPAPTAAAAAPATAQPAAGEESQTAPIAAQVRNPEHGDRSVLPRKPITAIFVRGRWDRMLALLTYMPLVAFGFFFLVGVVGCIRSVLRGEFKLTAPPLLWLLLIGGSLTTFPQFFFFRPDRPHLSEFMPGYIIAMMASAWLLWPRGTSRPAIVRVLAGVVALGLTAQLAVFAVYDLHHPSGGTIVARRGRKVRFRAEDGVYVHVTKHEAQTLQGIYDLVMKYSKPGEDLISFPYMPGYNVMTNRPTYLRNIYVDNATRGKNWTEDTIHDFEQKRPPVVIVDDRAINATNASRFSHWAAPVYTYLKKNYTVAGKFDTIEVFVPRAPAEQAPAAPATPATPVEPPQPKTAPATPAPSATPAPATPAPTTPAPSTPVPTTPVSSATPAPAATPAPSATPGPSATPAPATPSATPQPQATPTAVPPPVPAGSQVPPPAPNAQ
jgi:hypothetical protein